MVCNTFKKVLSVTSFFSIILFTFVSTAARADFGPAPDAWHFMVAPYGWLASVDGTVNINGTNHDFNIPFRDILQDLDGGAEMHMEGGYGPWSLMIDPTYLKLTKHLNVGPVKATITSQILLTDMGVFYQVASINMPKDQSISFEVLGGGRYLDIANSLNISALNFSTSNRSQFFAPIVGGRIKYDLTRRAEFWLRGDVGGFGVDHVTNTLSGTLGFGYAVSKHVDLGVAYRALKIDITQTNSSMNTWIYGPMIGISFHG